ncbi:Hypothetical_protein [Hexamita inflata]|uniref:Hypothetical_protein n=1 Tax=Hexamita inflata TaxID=28002 RepID=A0AA86NW39_9EUKA|nr:Hypothetical protein HINF_LOCUS13957 [Hexamita inflata]
MKQLQRMSANNTNLKKSLKKQQQKTFAEHMNSVRKQQLLEQIQTLVQSSESEEEQWFIDVIPPEPLPIIDEFTSQEEIVFMEQQPPKLFTFEKIHMVNMLIKSKQTLIYYLHYQRGTKKYHHIRTIQTWKAKMYQALFMDQKMSVEYFQHSVLNLRIYRQMLQVPCRKYIDGIVGFDAMSSIVRILSNALSPCVKDGIISQKALQLNKQWTILQFLVSTFMPQQNMKLYPCYMLVVILTNQFMGILEKSVQVIIQLSAQSKVSKVWCLKMFWSIQQIIAKITNENQRVMLIQQLVKYFLLKIE